MKNTKATSVDRIPTEVRKKSVTVLAGPISRICNLSLSTGIYPNLFKEAIVHPIYKGVGKDPRDPGSYRPISILPSLSKILEIVVRDALLVWPKERNVLPESQFGFLPGRSVDMALVCAQTDWMEAKSKGKSVGVMAFDFSSAFDTVDSKRLLSKLHSAGVTGTLLKWFSSYMSGRSQSVLWNDITSSPRTLTHGVPQGSILGPLLILVMVADLPWSVTSKMKNAKITGYADDHTVYVHANSLDELKSDLESVSKNMIDYCQSAGLVLNNGKTQLLVNSKEKFVVQMGSSIVTASSSINILGVDYDYNFTTLPYLNKLACASKTRAALLKRLSYGMPPKLLATFANGLLMGKILSRALASIPVRLEHDDRSFIGITEEINKCIKSVARTITKTKISDKVTSEVVLWRAGLRCLNEAVASIMAIMVWKSKHAMNPLGIRLFRETPSNRITRFSASNNICQPVPGQSSLASNVMARILNSMPGLQSASTLGAAKSLTQKWAKTIPR